ncbi:MAG TPA: O-methyltransferase [Candidatus Dormibacteraeota bacterium]|jgi:caffeoyl-CoA O-methyltransferase|nr:O-methyltransferase [Candidatus Dormibacteraeota bacterium]
MSPKSFLLNEQLHQYLVDHSLPLDDVQRSLIAETAALGDVSGMQVAPEQGAFLTVLTAALGAASAVEVGTFTGYSSLCIARGLVAGGHLLCCDVSEAWTAIGRRHWERAGVADRIELRIGPASETLRTLPGTATIDLAFVDADKRGYRDYAEQLIPRLRPGGVLLVDNVLWHGAVVEAGADADTNLAHIRAFNDWLAGNRAVESVMLPIADGVTLARKL